MSHSGLDPPSKGPSSPQRSRHQITRSISELSSPIRLHRHHSHHRANKERDNRDALSPAPQSAAPSNTQVRISLDGSPSGAVTPNLSPNPSRRTSILYAQPGDNNNNNNPLSSMGSTAPAASIGGVSITSSAAVGQNSLARANNNVKGSSNKASDVAVQDRQRAIAARESGLRTTLSHLETFQTASTRRLDTTYDSVVERLGTLQSTIIALKELAGLSRKINQTFTSEASELVLDTSSQLDTFGQFEDQQQRIDTLQRRVHVGRDKIRVLSERVHRVKERIERWERADREWQERTRRRLRWFWMVTFVLIFLVGLLVLSAQYTAPAGVSLGEATTQVVNDSLNLVKNVTMRANGSEGGKGNGGFGKVNSAVSSISSSTESTTSLALPTASTSLEDHDLLRAFDEL